VAWWVLPECSLSCSTVVLESWQAPTCRVWLSFSVLAEASWHFKWSHSGAEVFPLFRGISGSLLTWLDHHGWSHNLLQSSLCSVSNEILWQNCHNFPDYGAGDIPNNKIWLERHLNAFRQKYRKLMPLILPNWKAHHWREANVGLSNNWQEISHLTVISKVCGCTTIKCLSNVGI